jgi:hypothetical protein
LKAATLANRAQTYALNPIQNANGQQSCLLNSLVREKLIAESKVPYTKHRVCWWLAAGWLVLGSAIGW